MNASLALLRRLRRSGGRDVAQRLVRRLSDRLGAAALDFPILEHDIADSTRLTLPPSPRPGAAGARLGFICTPADAGSGGHTTLFRMVQSLVERGHACTLFLYDRHAADFETRRGIIRAAWPWLDVEFRDVEAGISGVDACVATSWETAHVLATHGTAPMARLAFVQDYEPLFHPRGTLAALAEDSYRFGFRTIALGAMVAGHLRDLGVDVDEAPFGCDTATYALENPNGPRAGVVFYAKPSSDRRGYLLGKKALELFHERHPEQPIHLYGARVADWSIPVVQHGMLRPAELATLYNGALAGIALSFTNISLVAEELLACGAVAVVNDSPDARADLPHPEARWALATPGAIADALADVVERTDAARPIRCAAMVRSGWAPAAEIVARVIDDELEPSPRHLRARSTGTIRSETRS
ncbi:glycosyltransferase family 1 protein [Microbacteriaceae bacterium VKM Ac-2855]|nr:glycosyltransferase family 1 protein [Microbacteriaceae bacterium VKM Ac-2855]